jgi:hypothetical protein
MKLVTILLAMSLCAVGQEKKAEHAQQPPPAAQPTAPQPAQQPPTIAQVLERQIGGLERQLVPLVEAMPEDKFDFKPSENAGAFKDVRTFAQQVKHVASGMHMLAAMQMGQPSPYTVEAAIMGPPELKTKAEILHFLKDGFAKAKQAAGLLTEKNATEMLQSPFGDTKISRLAQSNIVVWHGFDHYGQMVIYVRLNNIIPPASRN